MASTDARPVPIKNTAFRVTFCIWDADGDLVTGATGLDSEVSIDGGTFTDVTAEATEIATSSGMYYLDLTAAEMNGDTIAIIVKTTSSGAKTTPIVLYPNETGDIDVDVTAIGGGGQSATDLKDFADDGYDPSTNKVQGVVLVDTLTTYTGNTPQTGDVFLRVTGTGAVTFASLTVSGATTLTGSVTATNASNSIVGCALTTTAIAAIWTTALTESYAADGAAFTGAQAFYEICQGITEFAIASTTKTVKKRDGTTTAYTETLDSATAPTSITRAT